MATLEVRSLSGSARDGAVAIEGASFTVADGRIAAILGPSGSGKTALLRLLAGLDRANAGDVLLDDASVLDQPPHRRGFGLMFEDLALFAQLDVHQNVSFGLRMLGWPAADREQRVNDLLQLVRLDEQGARRIEALSDDERQRVALARTLAPQPSVLLLDEPLGVIDEARKAAARAELQSILDTVTTTTLIATRDLRDATAIADDLVVISGGRVLQAGALAAVLGQPASAEVAELAGYVTLADGVLRHGRVEEPGVGAVAVPEGATAGEPARAMAHPASLLAVPADMGLGCGVTGTVIRARAQGPAWVVDLALGPRQVEARWEWDLLPPRPGARLAIAAQPGTLRVFAAGPASAPDASLATTPTTPGTPTPRNAKGPGPALREHEQRHRGMPLA